MPVTPTEQQITDIESAAKTLREKGDAHDASQRALNDANAAAAAAAANQQAVVEREAAAKQDEADAFESLFSLISGLRSPAPAAAPAGTDKANPPAAGGAVDPNTGLPMPITA